MSESYNPKNRIGNPDLNKSSEPIPKNRDVTNRKKEQLSVLNDMCVDYINAAPEEKDSTECALKGYLMMCKWFEPMQYNELLGELEIRRAIYDLHLDANNPEKIN